MVLPGMIDVHTHLDKGHIWPRMPNPTGDSDGAGSAVGADREARWSAGDVRRRMEFGLATAYAHGVVAIRTHLDSLAPQAGISFAVFAEARERWAGRVDLQASSIAPLDVFLTDEGRALADTVAGVGGQLGCATQFRAIENVPLPPEFDRAMTTLFALARERGLNVDLHVDESGDREARTLLRVAQLAARVDFPGQILCGHCCSLAVQSDADIVTTLDACFAAGIDIVSLPTVNMYLQSRRAGVTPRWRGVPPLHEMKARGLRVAVAGDNVRDPFYAYGDHDMLDTFAQAVKILQLDTPLGDWIAAATETPAAIMGLADRGTLRPGAPADLIVLRARTYSELLARRQSDRVVLRGGHAIDTTLPDYRLLDDLMEPDSLPSPDR
jgi:cytosine deaminase